MAKSVLVEDLVQKLQKCRKIKDLKTAKDIHLLIQENGLDRNFVLGNHLVPTFVHCGSLPDALEVFEKLHLQNEVSWTSLINGYVENGQPEQGLCLYQKMEQHYIYPSKFTFVAVLKACVKLRCTEFGKRIHCDILKKGFDDNIFIGNSLVDMYAKCGAFLESQEVFDKLPERDAVSWNALITGYADNGYGGEAALALIDMQEQGVLPDATTFLCVLKSCTRNRAIDTGHKVHMEIIKEEFERDLFLGNTLVDMYAKCGALFEAKEVFNELAMRDIVSWNALISGYAENEHHDDVLHCLNEMQREGISPTTSTFVRILQACGATGILEKCQDMHTEVIQRGFDSEFFVGNTIVDMYSKCCALDDSRQVFINLSEKDVVSWNALIAGYAGHGYGEMALDCFYEMKHDGVSPDSITLSSSLKACASLGDIETGRELHAEVLKKGYQGNLFATSTLVDMYSKCRSLKEAQYVFDTLFTRDVVSWNALIYGYAEQGLNKEALVFLDQMQSEGVDPDSATFVFGLQACCAMRDINKAQELHADITREGLESAPCVSSALVNMYVKNGMLDAARDVFDEQSLHEITSWTTLVAGYAKDGHGEQVDCCLEEMQAEGITPNEVTFVSILKAYQQGTLDCGNGLHIIIAKMGLEKDPIIGSALIDMYVKCGTLPEAHKMFGELPIKDIVSWTALISGYLEHGLDIEALAYLELMQRNGFSLDLWTYICVLQACGNVGARTMGQEAHSEILKKGFEFDIYTVNALVDMYATFGMLTESRDVFERIRDPDLVSWTSLICGYAEHGFIEDAIECFYYMQSTGICPDEVAWNAIISGLAESGGVQEIFELFSEMQEQGSLPDITGYLNILKVCRSSIVLESGKRVHAQICNICETDEMDIMFQASLLEMYGKCGSMDQAREVFGLMPERVLFAWNSLITGYAAQGESKVVFSLFMRMLESGIHPDGETLCGLLNASSHAGLLTEVLDYFEFMIKEFCIIPNIKHYTCMVDLFGRAGHLQDATRILMGMPFQPDLVLFHAMLSACWKSGNREAAKELFEFAMALTGKHAASYVLMSNIF